jgi:hypothetical protein
VAFRMGAASGADEPDTDAVLGFGARSFTALAAGAGGGTRNINAMSSTIGRFGGRLAIKPATCRQASTKSATCPGLSTSPVRDTRICISAGLIIGTCLAGGIAMGGLGPGC